MGRTNKRALSNSQQTTQSCPQQTNSSSQTPTTRAGLQCLQPTDNRARQFTRHHLVPLSGILSNHPFFIIMIIIVCLFVCFILELMNLLLNFCYRRQNRIHPGTVIIIIFWPHVSKPNSPRYKSALCQNFEKFGSCGYQDNCEFAHGRQVRNDDDDVDDDDGDDDDVDDNSVCRQIFLIFKLHPIICPISIFPPNFHVSAQFRPILPNSSPVMSPPALPTQFSRS